MNRTRRTASLGDGQSERDRRTLGRHGTPRVHHRLLVSCERHLRAVLSGYVRHYNDHRPHRTLGQQPPNHQHTQSHVNAARVERRPILGGLINEYRRQPSGLLVYEPTGPPVGSPVWLAGVEGRLAGWP